MFVFPETIPIRFPDAYQEINTNKRLTITCRNPY